MHMFMNSSAKNRSILHLEKNGYEAILDKFFDKVLIAS